MDNVIDLGRLWLIVRRNWTFTSAQAGKNVLYVDAVERRFWLVMRNLKIQYKRHLWRT